MGKGFPGLGNPYNEFLGAGAVYVNYGEDDEYRLGLTKGGNEFNDNAEFREREADGDMGAVKGAIDIVSMRPQLTIRSLRIDAQAVQMYYAGLAGGTVTDGKQSFYRTVDLSGAYTDNIAFVGETRGGNPIVIYLDNVIGMNALNLAFAKSEETVPEIVFTATFDPATFDPATPTTYPYHVEFAVGEVTFMVKDGATPAVAVQGAAVTLADGQSALTDESGVASFDVTYGKIGYSVAKSGSVTVTGTLTVDGVTEAVAVTLAAAGS